MKTIITIGRQFGSGGKEVGIRVAKELGIPFYDKELLRAAAEKMCIRDRNCADPDGLRSDGHFPGKCDLRAVQYLLRSRFRNYFRFPPDAFHR